MYDGAGTDDDHELHFDLDHVSRTQVLWRIETRTGAVGCTCRNHVTGLEVVERRQIANQIAKREHQIAGNVVLTLFAIYPRAYVKFVHR